MGGHGKSKARRGSLNVDLIGALMAMTVLAGMLGLIVVKRRDLESVSERSRDLETAQNLLAELRAGGDPELPPGWSARREAVADGPDLVVLAGPGDLELRILAPEEGR